MDESNETRGETRGEIRGEAEERYLFEGGEPPDEPSVREVTRLERLLARYRWRPAPLDLSDREPVPAGPSPSLVSPHVLQRILVAAAVFVALMLGVQLFLPGGEEGAEGGYVVTGHAGADKIGRGSWLETGGGETVEIAVGDIGYVELEPGARVRLDDDGEEHHSLFLELGALTATIWAEPGVFRVGTPAGLTVDLGCIYRVEVDDEGRTQLRVDVGQVSFETEGRKVYVPTGASCEAVPGRGPSAPIFDEVEDPAFREAVAAVEFAEDPRAEMIALVAAARYPLTLWHLVRGAASVAVREAAYTALLQCEPPPAGVTREGVLAGDEEMLDTWRAVMDWDWGGPSPYSKGSKGKPAPKQEQQQKKKGKRL